MPGRKYEKRHLQKGRARKGALYEREKRNSSNIPESRVQLQKFIDDQNRELRNFIAETTEEEVELPNLDPMTIEDEFWDSEEEGEGGECLVESEYDSDEDKLGSLEM